MLAGGFGCFIFSSKKKTSNLTNTSTDFFRKAFAGFQPANLGVIRIRRFRCRDSGEILPLRDPCMLVYLPTFSHKNQPNVRRQIYHTWILRDECKVVFFFKHRGYLRMSRVRWETFTQQTDQLVTAMESCWSCVEGKYGKVGFYS